MLHVSSNMNCECVTCVSLFNLRHPQDFTSTCIILCGTFASFSPAPAGLSGGLGCGERRGTACTPRRKLGSRADSVALSLGIQSREIRQVITGSLSAKLAPSKTMENPHVSAVSLHCCISSTSWQLQHNSSRTSSLCGPLLCVCGHCVCVYVLCVCYGTCACV